MHIPDGFLSPPVWGSGWAAAAAFLGWGVHKTRQLLQEKMVPLMGVMCAFIFAAQMLNFPIMGGTSGHLLGGVLAAVLLGPWAASLVLACVLVIQCLVFQDGGLFVLGANIFNMAVMGTLGGYGLFRILFRLMPSSRGFTAAVAVAAWFSVVLASASCAIELALSGTARFGAVFAAMVGVHALIGIGEAFITMLVVEFVVKARPDLVYGLRAKNLS
ncbi:cobalamin biosynthesis protein CbiM [Candidatus Velamenicoccus archaeovorus]|uniref:Cobalamin biosynthesis protein CbiM n=1 Tax=Velamenicoccus archaeovorus TaxID=1930593 RepID=A0A410P6S4_VELA1|nr:energy-coupling factor ABC transporter permease [Candidatus Velamenicoccus archaeovorus]QAT17768.1 cobalamin biosynthesis protein CbiM [Candidatus Velamenicoccus archaeovorus]